MATWSIRQANLSDGWVMLVEDFSKNRTHVVNFQDKIKSAFFGQKQLTMHPSIIFYYMNSKAHRESCVFISNDTKHDYHAAQHFFQKSLNTLMGRGLRIQHVTVYSDRCAAQYTIRPFRGSSSSLKWWKLILTIQRQMWGQRHTKNSSSTKG